MEETTTKKMKPINEYQVNIIKPKANSPLNNVLDVKYVSQSDGEKNGTK